ncbi:rhodanese-like domain-containing protein [Lactobacillaceae bacterium Melli_B4]
MDGFNLNIPHITTDELESKLNQGIDIELIDVREPDEYNAGHIEQSRNVPLPEIDKFNEDSKRSIYVICQSGRRSQRAAEILIGKGYNAVNVEDGMNLWTGKTVK